MDLPQLTDLIRRSTLLTTEERAYWLSASPSMKPEQLAKLEQILVAAEQIPLQQSVQNYFAAVKQSKAPLAA